MTQLALRAFDSRPFGLLSGTGSGASMAAEKLNALYSAILSDWTKSATGNKRFAEAFESLEQIWQKCQSPNWDGEDAEPIAREAISEARALLVSLPSSVKMPDIFPEASGSIAFEWYRAQGYRYVITVSGIRTIEFAGLFGNGNEVYGEFRIEAGFPRPVKDHLEYLYE